MFHANESSRFVDIRVVVRTFIAVYDKQAINQKISNAIASRQSGLRAAAMQPFQNYELFERFTLILGTTVDHKQLVDVYKSDECCVATISLDQNSQQSVVRVRSIETVTGSLAYGGRGESQGHFHLTLNSIGIAEVKPTEERECSAKTAPFARELNGCAEDACTVSLARLLRKWPSVVAQNATPDSYSRPDRRARLLKC